MTRLETTTSYCLSDSYQPRLDNDFFDDTCIGGDAWQKEVYLHARKFADPASHVTDIGCGNGYKLVTYFADCVTFGFDLTPTVVWLNKTYPERTWLDTPLTSVPPIRGGLVISADVIEHLPEPNQLLNFVYQIRPDKIVLSTPERLRLQNLQTEWRADGPPVNPAHVREWSFDEFEEYVGSLFKIEEHFISNESQGTQCVVCSLV